MPSWRKTEVAPPVPNTFYNPGVLGGRGPNRLTYTKAQVGAAAEPNPAPPGATGWVGSNSSPNPRQQQYPSDDRAGTPAFNLPSPVRAFRGRGWGAPPDVIFQGPGTLAPSGAVTGSGSETLVGHSAGNGFPSGPQPTMEHAPAYPVTSGNRFRGAANAVPDSSRQWNSQGDPTGYPLAVSPEAYPKEFMSQNQPVTGVGGGGQVPAEWRSLGQKLLNQRPKAGGTSEDDYRPARRWTQPPGMRPFDKNGLSYRFGGRHSLPSPLASTPLFYPEPVSGGVPSPAGGAAARGMLPVYIQRNTARLVPQPWDAGITNAGSGDGTAAVQSSYRSRAWKAG